MRLAVRGILLSLALVLALPVSAEAFPSFCSFDAPNERLTVIAENDNLAVDDRLATLSVSAAGAIQLNGGPCATATTTNTDDIHVGFNTTVVKVVIDISRPFSPGVTAEPGLSEIEFTVAENGPNGFGNGITFAGGPGADHWEAGQGDSPPTVFDGNTASLFDRDGAVDLNPDEVRPDADVLWDNADAIVFDGGGGNDTIDLRGGTGAGAAYTFNATVRGGEGADTVTLGGAFVQSAEGGPGADDLTGSALDGGDGDDHLTGVQFDNVTGGPGADVIDTGAETDTVDAGPGDDIVLAGAGSDTIELGEDDDRVQPGLGNDTVRGDEGVDVVDASASPGPVTYDLAIGDALQDTGEGSDRLIGLEGAIGSPAGDALLGNAGADSLRGGGGDDTLVDRGGADVLDGGPGADTASYAESPVAVSIDLGAKTASAGGIDTLDGLERVVGSPFGDVIAGGPGPDDIAAGDGNDLVALRDGAADTADCGAGADTAEVDAAGDVLAGCETVAFPPPPPPPPPCVPATEIPGNGADENCDGVDAPFPRVESRLRSLFDVFRRFATPTRLQVVELPAGATIDIRCRGRGCPYAKRTRTFASARKRLNLLKAMSLRDARLRPRTVLQVRILVPGHVGKVVRFKMRKAPKLPVSGELCLPPGATRPAKCT